MNYSEALTIKNNNRGLIDTDIIRDEIKYRVRDIVICPAKAIVLFAEDYKKYPSAASNRYMGSMDCEVWLYSLNLTSGLDSFLPIENTSH